MIFFKKELEDAINFSVFPGLQGGPHNNQIAGLALQLLEADSEDFRDYIRKVKLNGYLSLGEIIQVKLKQKKNNVKNRN